MTMIYCKVTAKGKLGFYMNAGGKDYYLFTQKYRKSTKNYFYKGRPITGVFNMGGVYSASTRKTIEKLRSAILYIEKEYGIWVLKSSEKKNNRNSKVAPYKRKAFGLIDAYQSLEDAV